MLPDLNEMTLFIMLAIQRASFLLQNNKIFFEIFIMPALFGAFLFSLQQGFKSDNRYR